MTVEHCLLVESVRIVIKHVKLPAAVQPATIASKHGTLPCVGLMLGQRRRRWANIEPTHGQCPVLGV